ncbi:MAG: trigger factor [Pseudomonadota bacterium]
MQVTETNVDGLKRELTVTVAATDLVARVDERLEELKTQVRLKGFRPGKVPMTHLKRMYGRSVMAEVLQQAVNETSQQALTERNERPALQPEIVLPEDETEVEKVIAGEADLAYDMKFEVLPEIELADLSKLELEKPVAEIPQERVDESLEQLRKNATTYEDDPTREAADGDRVTVDFVGTIDDEPFEGGTAQDVQVVIGMGGFIPGFEEQLVGVKADDQIEIKVTFPEAYPAEVLAGKDAVFATTVKAVAEPQLPELDDAFAEKLGVESLDKLTEILRGNVEAEFTKASRAKVKRALLDKLADVHTFQLPPSLVQNEFDGIWNQLQEGLQQAGKTIEDEGKTDDEARAEYMEIAERRVRLGLVISTLGEKNEIAVSDEEVQRAIIEQARRYPGQEKQVIEALSKSPEAVMGVRAPIYEDKVVDFALELATVTPKDVTVDELFAEDDEDEGAEESAA